MRKVKHCRALAVATAVVVISGMGQAESLPETVKRLDEETSRLRADLEKLKSAGGASSAQPTARGRMLVLRKGELSEGLKKLGVGDKPLAYALDGACEFNIKGARVHGKGSGFETILQVDVGGSTDVVVEVESVIMCRRRAFRDIPPEKQEKEKLPEEYFVRCSGGEILSLAESKRSLVAYTVMPVVSFRPNVNWDDIWNGNWRCATAFVREQ